MKKRKKKQYNNFIYRQAIQNYFFFFSTTTSCLREHSVIIWNVQCSCKQTWSAGCESLSFCRPQLVRIIWLRSCSSECLCEYVHSANQRRLVFIHSFAPRHTTAFPSMTICSRPANFAVDMRRHCRRAVANESNKSGPLPDCMNKWMGEI